MCVNELARKAWENPNTKYWFISPTYDQAKIQYRRMVGMFGPCLDILTKRNQSELRIRFENQSEVVFKSGEVLDNLRGETLNGVVIDEVRDQHPELWPMVIRPMLATTQGWAAFVSTPRGFDQFYDLYQLAVTDRTGTWASFHAPSTCNPLFTIAEREEARRSMSEPEFAQEILAEFRDITAGKAYINHGPHNWRETSVLTRDGSLISPHLPILVCMDFNVGHLRWTLGQVNTSTFYFYDEISLENSHTMEAAKELVSRVKGHKPGIILVGDATGSARKTAASGETDYSILGQILDANKIPWVNHTPDSNPPVKDRINIVNARLKSADGAIYLFYHPIKCPSLRKDFERVTWKKGAQAILDQTSDPSLTHASDGVGYAVCVFTDIWKPSPGVLRVINR
jgi:hypothetical protein